jgi:acylglycerol lipase
MTNPIEEYIGGRNGKLFVRAWRPSASPRAVVAICPGFNSHSGRYSWAAGQCVRNGLAAYAVDLRGRGRSEGERFYVESIEGYVEDLATLIRLAKSREPDLPVYLLGHSAGGVTSCVYALDHQNEIAGLICESFAFQVPAPNFALAVLKGLSHIAPHTHSLALSNADFSRDPAVVEDMNADPLITHESQPIGTMAALVHANEILKRDFTKITLPVLIIHGADDRATKPSGSQQFYDRAGSTDKTLKIYDGRFHDMLNDLGKEEVIGDIISWIDVRVAKS